jgi:hypothetical protein
MLAVGSTGEIVVAVTYAVLSVRRRGVPAKVLQPVVGGNSVVVAPDQSVRGRADESFENQPMNKLDFHSTVATQIDSSVT